MAPKVSVLMPTRNRAHLISESVSSVLSQSLSDLELIIVDDMSTDNTREVVAGIKDARIRYFFRTKAHGEKPIPAYAYNYALGMVRGEYIAYCDSDDILYPDHLKKMTAVLDRSPDIDVVCCKHYTRGPDGRLWDRNSNEYGKQMFARKYLEVYNNECTNIDFVHRAGCLEKVPSFVEDMGEDWDFWIRLNRHCTVFFLDELLCEYRDHSGNIMKQVNFTDIIISVYRRNYASFYHSESGIQLPYDDYYLDAAKFLCSHASRQEYAKVARFFEELQEADQTNPSLYLARALICLYFQKFGPIPGLTARALQCLSRESSPLLQPGWRFLSYYLYISCVILDPGNKELLLELLGREEYCRMIELVGRTNLKLLRFHGGMFFSIAVKLIRSYMNARKNLGGMS